MKSDSSVLRGWLSRAPGPSALGEVWPGMVLCTVLALAATFVSEHYGGPQLLYALLVGLACNFLSTHERVMPGVTLCARTGLRCGVALLGARITLEQVAGLGIGTGLGIAASLVATIVFGVVLARVMKRPVEEGVISGCSVGICGASAALAVAAALPATRENERFTLLTVVGVTLMSTLALVLYPLLLNAAHVPPQAAGIVLGGTIHDIAQVVAAGLILGPEAGETATIVKLFRVALLVPVVAAVAFLYRRRAGIAATGRVPAVPPFLLWFLFFVVLASAGVISANGAALAGDASRWLLVTAIAAAGIKTNFAELARLGWRPVVMLLAETLFIAVAVCAWAL